MPSLDIKPFVYLELYGPIPMYGTTDVSEGTRIVYKINPRWNNQFEFELPKSAYKQTLVAFSLWDNQALAKQSENQIIGRCVVHIANLRYFIYFTNYAQTFSKNFFSYIFYPKDYPILLFK